MDSVIYYSYQDSAVEIQTEMTKNKITFLIVDHGIDIIESDRSLIFERCYCREKFHTKKGYFGLGLVCSGN